MVAGPVDSEASPPKLIEHIGIVITFERLHVRSSARWIDHISAKFLPQSPHANATRVPYNGSQFHPYTFFSKRPSRSLYKLTLHKFCLNAKPQRGIGSGDTDNLNSVRFYGTRSIGYWIGLTAGLETLEMKGKILSAAGNQTVVVSRCSDVTNLSWCWNKFIGT
jgi:hypothetical protein